MTTFFEWYGMEALREKSFVWQKFFYDVRDFALKQDADRNYTIENALVPPAEWIKTESDASRMFKPGWIRYKRGACMMAMLRSMLGDELLLQSITSYLTIFAHSTAITSDLFNVLAV